jgi:hypothetical protein
MKTAAPRAYELMGSARGFDVVHTNIFVLFAYLNTQQQQHVGTQLAHRSQMFLKVSIHVVWWLCFEPKDKV